MKSRWWWPERTPNDDPNKLGSDSYEKKSGTDPEKIPGESLGSFPAEKFTEPEPDPEPDLSTKPEDVVGYCFGYACPKKHVFGFFDSITPDKYKVRRPCPDCGGISKPAVVRRVAEAKWGPGPLMYWDGRGVWQWQQYFHMEPLWNHFEFVHYLDSPKKPVRRKKK